MWLYTFKSQFISVTKKKKKVVTKGVIIRGFTVPIASIAKSTRYIQSRRLQLCRLKKWGVTDCTNLLTLHPHLLVSLIPSSNFSPRSSCPAYTIPSLKKGLKKLHCHNSLAQISLFSNKRKQQTTTREESTKEEKPATKQSQTWSKKTNRRPNNHNLKQEEEPSIYR